MMTVDEFLDWPGDGTATKYDLADGVPRAMAPSMPVHGLIQANAARLLGNHMAAQRRLCPVLTEAAVIPRLGNNANLRIPDVTLTCARLSASDRVVAEPLLIVEVLSPSNEPETRNNVWSYISIPSLREVLLLRSDRVQAEAASRGPDGAWPIGWRIYPAGSTMTLESIGFTAPVEVFYALTHLLEPATDGQGDVA